MQQQVAVESNAAFFASGSGKWAGEQFLKALSRGEPISPAHLRTLDTLRKDEWKAFDETLVEEGAIRLAGVADLINAGLVVNVTNGLGKTVFEYEKVTDMNPAEVSLDGNVRTMNDRQEYDLASIPLPIIHKDFHINLRTLMASRERGDALDTTQVRTAGRLVAEKQEDLLFNGFTKGAFMGLSLYGYTTHPNRNSGGFGAGVWSASGRTGAEILTDLHTMITALKDDRFYGPYWLYVPGNTETKLDEDYKSESDLTIRERLLRTESLQAIRVVDTLADDNVILVQATQDVVSMVNGEPLQTIQWDINGGFRVNFKAFTISVPLIKADAQGRSGVYHMS